MTEKRYDIGRRELTALMDAMLNGGIKVKSAAEVGKRAVEYTRGDEMMKWILSNKDRVRSMCPTHIEDMDVNKDDELVGICDILIDEGFIYRAQYQPIEGTIEKTASGSFKRPTWPKRLIKTSKQQFDSVGFYIIAYEGNQKWNHFMLFAMITGIFALCMFQAWPLALKLATWYASVVLLSILLTLVVIRLILFSAFWFCGYDYWLFPNLFDEDLGVFDSFRPVHSLKYRNDAAHMIMCRIVCSILVAASIHELGKTHDLKDVGMFAKQSFLDIIEWGHNKLTALPEEQSIYQSIGMDISTEFDAQKSPEEQDEDGMDDDDYKCLLGCGYKSLKHLMKGCMLKCDCMTELLGNPCLADCPEETVRVLTESKVDICKKTRRG
ncbi:translocation protein sec62 like protein [Babesia gibsoni]|uniref:Translocation protein SEC62 n=1 Tax=Babesia gibsoni TaxID=33632 RepID=A0AAD8PFY8_BABGI|nr:translocation protein sec62 like protein [Babesia gibsoni]